MQCIRLKIFVVFSRFAHDCFVHMFLVRSGRQICWWHALYLQTRPDCVWVLTSDHPWRVTFVLSSHVGKNLSSFVSTPWLTDYARFLLKKRTPFLICFLRSALMVDDLSRCDSDYSTLLASSGTDCLYLELRSSHLLMSCKKAEINGHVLTWLFSMVLSVCQVYNLFL